MESKDHINGVGSIVTNLQALESVLRAFLLERYGQRWQFPKVGDTTADMNYLTNWISLGDLIEEYHRDLADHEKEYSIDVSVVTIRDALAHGRLFVRGSDPKPPYELWKFAKSKDGKMPVEFSETLTQDWLKAKWELVDSERKKVVACSTSRGYKLLK
jgi:hypothetical protein